ncbi:MAG: peptide ABC transporter substrate-binding protein [Opitutaceae bacterium]|jgi:oligopeptide transport system substrate-binding protein|nr:peptide ABC transporter substrate-binding protein [Opitutaceae bacterium]
MKLPPLTPILSRPLRPLITPISPLLLLLVILGCALALSGCGGRRNLSVAEANQTRTLLVGNLAEPNDLDPHIADSHQTFQIIMALFEGLAQYDPVTCEPRPAVATRWEVSDDGLTWTFYLRPDARWSNGDPLTAHDFVFAYRRMLSPGLAAEYASMLYALKNGEAFNTGKITTPGHIGARADDDHTLVLALEHPVPYLPAMVCHSAWYPVHPPTLNRFGPPDQRGTPWTRPGNLVGNGYFTLAEWTPHQRIRCVKSATYWDRENVLLNEVVFFPIENEDAEERAFRTGQLHVTDTLPLSKIAVYKNDPRGVYQPSPMLATYFYRFNVHTPPLDDARVRRALTLAIDRERLVRLVARGGQLPATGLTPPGLPGFAPAAARPATDIAQAQQLLAAAGFPGGAGFPRLEILYNTNQGHRRIAEAISEMWRRDLGIDIGLYNQESKVWTETMRRRDYQIARSGWVGDYLDPSAFLDIMASDNGNNQTGWANAEYDRLLTLARSEPDPAKRLACYQRCEAILAAEAPLAPIYFYVRNRLLRPEVKGWTENLLGLHPLKGVSIAP